MLFNYRHFYKLYYFLLLLLVITGGGVVGFMLIEGWGFIDSLYMTIITISTVGFGEVHELTVYGRLFTSFLVVSSFGTFAYAITSITQYIVGGEYKTYFNEYRTMQASKELKDHVIVCGYGRVGRQVTKDLEHTNCAFVVIEQDAVIIEEAKRTSDYLFLRGNSTSDEILDIAGIHRARAIITCLPNDADNVYVVLAAREANKSVLIVSRASQDSAVSKLRMAGADNVIMPDSIGGSHMASLIANRDVMEFLDMIRIPGFDGANIISVAYEDLTNDLRSATIGELRRMEISGVSIIGMKSVKGEYLVNPSDDLTLSEGCRLFVLGSSAQILKLKKYFGLE